MSNPVPDGDHLFQSSVSAAPEVLVQELPDGELVLLHGTSGSYFGLGRVGSHMFRALTAGPTVGGACEGLIAQFDVDPDRLRQDVRSFVGGLAERGLIVVEAPPPAAARATPDG